MSQLVSVNLMMELVLEMALRSVKDKRLGKDNTRLQHLKNVGEKVGYQLSERLLHREKISIFTPERMIIFISFSVWRSLFGRSACYACSEANSFILRDQGFLVGQEGTVGAPYPLIRMGCRAGDSLSVSSSEENTPFLLFLSGIIRGSLLAFFPYPLPLVACEISNDNTLIVLITFDSI